jgi:hypothetical protein
MFNALVAILKPWTLTAKTIRQSIVYLKYSLYFLLDSRQGIAISFAVKRGNRLSR